MLLAALIDAGADLRNIQRVLDLIPSHYPRCNSIRLDVREVKTHGFRAREVDLKISEDTGKVKATQMLEAAHRIASVATISERAVTFAKKSVKLLVETEGQLHGVDIQDVHLHEAGSTDTLADIFGVATACDSLEIFGGDVYATPVAVGGGITTFSHGRLATPVPAVLEILREIGAPILGGPERVELATPTGVAMLANLATRFVEMYPAMVPEIVGYGAGRIDLASAPNLLRVVIGQSTEHRLGSDAVQVLETNLDDLSGEVLGHALQRVLDSGGKDAWLTPAQFKKNRPGHVLHVICDIKDGERLSRIIMEETGTLGVRYLQLNRFTLERHLTTIRLQINGKLFEVRVKFARDSYGRIIRVKPEFDDIRAIAETVSMPAREISDLALREARRTLEKGTEER